LLESSHKFGFVSSKIIWDQTSDSGPIRGKLMSPRFAPQPGEPGLGGGFEIVSPQNEEGPAPGGAFGGAIPGAMGTGSPAIFRDRTNPFRFDVTTAGQE
jgi:hypothetical protein